MDVVKAEYDRIENFMNTLLLTLDKYNQTVEFDVDIWLFFRAVVIEVSVTQNRAVYVKDKC